MSVKTKVDTTKLNNIIKHSDGNTAEVVHTIGLAVVAEAQVLAPKDTGALAASIYMRTRNTNDMPGIATDVVRVELPEPKTKTSVTVGPSVEYGIVQELGSVKQSAQPHLLPAINRIAKNLKQYAKQMGKTITDG